MHLFKCINMLACQMGSRERPNQVHDLYRQINGIILNVKNGNFHI